MDLSIGEIIDGLFVNFVKYEENQREVRRLENLPLATHMKKIVLRVDLHPGLGKSRVVYPWIPRFFNPRLLGKTGNEYFGV